MHLPPNVFWQKNASGWKTAKNLFSTMTYQLCTNNYSTSSTCRERETKLVWLPWNCRKQFLLVFHLSKATGKTINAYKFFLFPCFNYRQLFFFFFADKQDWKFIFNGPQEFCFFKLLMFVDYCCLEEYWRNILSASPLIEESPLRRPLNPIAIVVPFLGDVWCPADRSEKKWIIIYFITLYGIQKLN